MAHYHFTEDRLDTSAIRHARVGGQETLARAEGEAVETFIARVADAFGKYMVVTLVDHGGTPVARTVGGYMMPPLAI